MKKQKQSTLIGFTLMVSIQAGACSGLNVCHIGSNSSLSNNDHESDYVCLGTPSCMKPKVDDEPIYIEPGDTQLDRLPYIDETTDDEQSSQEDLSPQREQLHQEADRLSLPINSIPELSAKEEAFYDGNQIAPKHRQFRIREQIPKYRSPQDVDNDYSTIDYNWQKIKNRFTKHKKRETTSITPPMHPSPNIHILQEDPDPLPFFYEDESVYGITGDQEGDKEEDNYCTI